VLLQILRLLDSDQLAECRVELTRANWIDGRATAGYLSDSVKENQQIAENITYRRTSEDWLEQVCAENFHEY
jgi:PKHD-type hydroxylase